MTNKKLTKRENYIALATILNAMEESGYTLDIDGITYDSLQEFLDNEIKQLDAKTQAYKKRAEEKRAEGDVLRDTIYSLMTTDWITIDDLVRTINDPDVSKNMVTSRLTQLVQLGTVEKTTQSVTSDTGKTRKFSIYRRFC